MVAPIVKTVFTEVKVNTSYQLFYTNEDLIITLAINFPTDDMEKYDEIVNIIASYIIKQPSRTVDDLRALKAYLMDITIVEDAFYEPEIERILI